MQRAYCWGKASGFTHTPNKQEKVISCSTKSYCKLNMMSNTRDIPTSSARAHQSHTSYNKIIKFAAHSLIALHVWLFMLSIWFFARLLFFLAAAIAALFRRREMHTSIACVTTSVALSMNVYDRIAWMVHPFSRIAFHVFDDTTNYEINCNEKRENYRNEVISIERWQHVYRMYGGTRMWR